MSEADSDVGEDGLTDLGRRTFAKMWKELFGPDAGDWKFRFSKIPDFCRPCIDFYVYEPMFLDLVNLGWPVFRFEDEVGEDIYAFPDDFVARQKGVQFS